MERLRADLRELREGEALDVEAVDVFEDVGEEFDPERERERGQPRGERSVWRCEVECRER